MRKQTYLYGLGMTHLIQVGLQRFILCTLLRKLSLGFSALVLDLLRL
jgi:hypothetical protein